MKTNQCFIFLMLFLFLFTACNPQKKAAKQAENAAILEAQKIIGNVSDKPLPTAISAKAKVKYKAGKNNISLKAYLRAEKDKHIWMSVKKFGFEGARILFTPDSVFIINRIQKNYVAEDYGYINQTFDLPIAFDGIQAMIYGSPYFFENGITKATIEGDKYYLNSVEKDIQAEYTIQSVSFNLLKMVFLQKDKVAEFNFENFKSINTYNIPLKREITAKSGEIENIGIIFDMYDVELDETYKIKFDIPSNYKRVRYQ